MTIPVKKRDIRRECLDAALVLIEEKGLESLSLREVARRLGISHQAPYKHFESRDDILAAVISEAYRDFAAYLERATIGLPASPGFRAMGMAFMQYAREHPLKYRLLFSTPMPSPDRHPEMVKNATLAFNLLRGQLQNLTLRPIATGFDTTPTHDAMLVWSILHGLASLLQSDALGAVGLTPMEIGQSVAHCFARLSFALGIGPESKG